MDSSPAQYFYNTLAHDGSIGLDADDNDWLISYKNRIINTETFTISDEEYTKNT